MNYWQHRISHMWDVSKQLMDQGFLTIGWQGLSQSSLLQATRDNGEEGFNQVSGQLSLTSRNRWCLYRFFSMNPGDVVVVPLYEQSFAIIEVTECAKPICALPIKTLKSVCGRDVELTDALRYTDTNTIIDLGYYVSFDPNKIRIVRRAYASSRLQSRMKHQYINICIDELKEDIAAAATAEGPIDLRDVILEATAPRLLEAMHKLTPDGLEHLVEWYMRKIGANYVYIPAKNEAGKTDGADADVIAEFTALHIVFFIQVKKHEGYTADWAIKQIDYYRAQKENTADDFTYIPWVITTAAFTEEVKEYAHSVGVRLVDGITFAKMILDTGIESINEVLDYLK